MAEKLIIATLEPVEVGEQFPSLPLHVTLMPWFEIDPGNVPRLRKYLGLIASKRSYLEFVGEDIDMFGPEHDVRVRKILAHPEIVRAHSDISAAVAWSEGKCDSEYIHGAYSPHVSFVDGVSIGEGQSVKADALQLIDRDPETRQRTVEKIFPLSAPFDSDAEY